ncbi:MAG: hypothetical protein L0099_13640, partial [Acidobacteria bacterium]|nr:hypothetical protein [Acidobacteriota bacterium]
VILAASQSSFAARQQGSEENLRITVRVHDYVQVENELMAGAQKEAARILANAGIETEWLSCAVVQPEAGGHAACERPFGRNELLMRIVPEAMAAKLPFRDITLGFAFLPEEGGRGFLGGVFYHKVERMARETGTDGYQILAHVLAHEIGHLLLRTVKHGHTGLMRANWGPNDLELARRGLLPFTPKESARLRAEVRARMESSVVAGLAVGASR